jgi:hypothetical protein
MHPSKEGQRPSWGRREFLKGTGLAIAGATLHGNCIAAESEHGIQSPAEPGSHPKSLIDMANLIQGTSSTYAFSRGNTLPLATDMRSFCLSAETQSPRLARDLLPGDRKRRTSAPTRCASRSCDFRPMSNLFPRNAAR